MALVDPVVVYTAASNVEVQLLKVLLVAAGVEAFAAEDLSAVSFSWGGALSSVMKPDVWVSKIDVDRARTVIREYEAQAAERALSSAGRIVDDITPIEVLCEDCGKSATFPAEQRGSVQDCPHCGGYVDVGEPDSGDAYWLGDAEPEKS